MLDLLPADLIRSVLEFACPCNLGDIVIHGAAVDASGNLVLSREFKALKKSVAGAVEVRETLAHARAVCRLFRMCPVPLTVRGRQALVSFAPLAFKLFCAARQNAVLRRSPFPPP